MGTEENPNFPGLDKDILKSVVNFVHPRDRYMFDSSEFELEEGMSKDEFIIHLIENEFSLSSNEIGSFYKRIEFLTNLNSSLDRFLTESNDQRYSKIMDATLYNDFSENFSQGLLKTVPIVRKCFNEYKSSTLYDFRSILKGYNNLKTLRSYLPFLEIFREMNIISEYSKKLEVPVTYRILSCVFGIQYSSNISKSDPRILETMFFNILRDGFSRNIGKYLTNIFLKNQYGYDSCDKLLIFLIFGQTSEKCCEYVIGFLKQELESLVSLTIQKYLNLEKDLSKLNFSGFNTKDISSKSAILCPNLSLLVVCKILSEFVTFFQNLTSKLKYESKIIHHNKFKFNSGSVRLDRFLNGLKKVDYYLYYRNCLDLFLSKLEVLVDFSFNLLYKVLSSFNLVSLKDRNDVLKMSLLVLYYIVLQKCLKDGNKTSFNREINCKHVGLDTELSQILNEFCENNLRVNLYNGNYLEHSTKNGLEKLENLLSEVLVDYSKKFTLESLENVFISLETDNLNRIVAHPFLYQNCSIEHFCKIFENFILEGSFVTFNHFKFSSLNPFVGWTPNSNFVTINISSKLFSLYNVGCNHSLNRDNESLNGLKWSKLVKDYGGAYTLTSQFVLRSFENYLKIMMLQPKICLEIVKSYTELVDEFIYRNINSCKMESCVIENLKKFNRVICNPKRISERSLSLSTCDTFRQEFNDGERVSELSKLSTVVNSVESCFTVIEALVPLINQNCKESPQMCKYLTEYYNERNEVIMELRLMLYHIGIYNLLRPKLPSVRILQSSREPKQLHICADVDKIFRDFKIYLGNVKEFLESADSGSFSVMVKLFLWDSVINVVKDSFKPLINALNSDTNTNLYSTVSKSYSETLELANEIRAKYVEQVKTDYKNHKIEIASMGTYDSLIERFVNNIK